MIGAPLFYGDVDTGLLISGDFKIIGALQIET